MTGPEIAAEVMKALRTRWMSPYQLAREVGIEIPTAAKWAKGLADYGLLQSRRNPKFAHLTGDQWLHALEYMVAPAWRGA